jgi:hypothetical protein
VNRRYRGRSGDQKLNEPTASFDVPRFSWASDSTHKTDDELPFKGLDPTSPLHHLLNSLNCRGFAVGSGVNHRSSLYANQYLYTTPAPLRNQTSLYIRTLQLGYKMNLFLGIDPNSYYRILVRHY